MLDGYNIREQKLPHFITATVVDWIEVLNLNNFTKYNEYWSSNAARSGDHRRAYSSINKLRRAE